MPADWPPGFTAPSGPGRHAITVHMRTNEVVVARCRCGAELGAHPTADGTGGIQRAWRRHRSDVVLGEAS